MQITTKNTKAEIFKAFEDMKGEFKKVNREKVDMSKNTVVKKSEDEIIKKTSEYSPESLEGDVSTLRKKMGKQLDEIMDQLINESKKLKDLRKVKGIEKRKLEEIYNIQLSSDTLEVLISDFDKKKQEFEDEILFRKNEFRKEVEEKRKNWEREQEEYKYKLKFERKQDEETYDAEQLKKRIEWKEKVESKEIELQKREDEVVSRENEIQVMKNQIEKFPKKLEDTTNSIRHKTEKYLNREFGHKKQLLEQMKLAEENISKVKVENLQNLIKNQNEEIHTLKEGVIKANQRSQSLAVAVVEGVSGAKQLEQLKQDSKILEVNRESND